MAGLRREGSPSSVWTSTTRLRFLLTADPFRGSLFLAGLRREGSSSPKNWSSSTAGLGRCLRDGLDRCGWSCSSSWLSGRAQTPLMFAMDTRLDELLRVAEVFAVAVSLRVNVTGYRDVDGPAEEPSAVGEVFSEKTQHTLKMADANEHTLFQ